MPFSILNGLSALGSGVAQFAGAAGLDYQKAQLANQSQILANQLATTRETTLAGQRQTFEAGQTEKQIAARTANLQSEITARSANVATEQAGATARSDAAIAAAAPSRQEEILASRQKTALEAVQTQNAQDLQNAHQALQAEVGKPDADPAKIASLKSQVTTLETSANTEAATTQAAATMYRTDMDAVQHYNTQLVTATAALNQPDMTDTDRNAQKALIGNLQTQLKGAQRALQYSSDLVHGRVGTATGEAPPGTAPAMPSGVPAGARYSPSLKIWQAPDGSLFNAQGQPTTAPGKPGLINSPAVIN